MLIHNTHTRARTHKVVIVSLIKNYILTHVIVLMRSRRQSNSYYILLLTLTLDHIIKIIYYARIFLPSAQQHKIYTYYISYCSLRKKIKDRSLSSIKKKGLFRIITTFRDSPQVYLYICCY